MRYIYDCNGKVIEVTGSEKFHRVLGIEFVACDTCCNTTVLHPTERAVSVRDIYGIITAEGDER